MSWYSFIDFSLYRGAPRLRTDRRAQSAKRGFASQNGRRAHRGYPTVNMPRGVNGQTRMEQNGLSNTPTDEEYKDERYAETNESIMRNISNFLFHIRILHRSFKFFFTFSRYLWSGIIQGE